MAFVFIITYNAINTLFVSIITYNIYYLDYKDKMN